MLSKSSHYIMEDPREGERLVRKVGAEQWVERYMLDRLKPGAKVLDVGCGPGHLTCAIASACPGVFVTGVDASDERLEKARGLGSSQTVFHQADARELPFESDSFDVVVSRFLLEYLDDKRGAVKEWVRVCRPRGTMLLQDLDGQMLWHYPIAAELQEKLETVIKMLERTGFDPFVGRKLFSLQREAGLVDIQVILEPYHLYPGRIPSSELAMWETKLDIASNSLKGLMGDDVELGPLRDLFISHLVSPDTLTYSIQFTVSGRKPL